MTTGNHIGNLQLLRFGVFDLDLRTQELRKHGTRVKLPRQSFQVLQMLLERPGELVTREELHKALWPADTFVDFDHGLNNAVKRIRAALGDSADAPHWVETLPRLGYRFIGSVEATANGNGKSLNGNGSGLVVASPSSGAAISSMPSDSAVTSRRRFGLRWMVGAVALLLVSLGWWQYRRMHRASTDVLQITPFTSYPGYEFAPTFSPDGNQIAFSWTGSDQSELFELYVKVVGTDTPAQLTHNPASIIIPAWSPDGRFIAFSRFKLDSAEESGIFVIPAVGGPERKVAALNFGKYIYQGGLTWTPDSRALVYPEPRETEFKSQLVVVNVDSLERRPLPVPTPRCTATGLPRFSPDGKFLAFACMYSFGLGGLYAQPWPTGPAREVLEVRGEVGGLTWAADARSLVYTSNANLWRVPVRGGTPERLLFGQDAYTPAVAPTGSRLAFTHQEEAVDLYRLPLGEGEDSSEHAERLVPSELSQKNAEYSPDGKRLVFESNRSGALEVWVCNADGTNPLRLTSFGGPLTGTPRWSPDGRRIVLDSRASGKPELYIVNADGGPPQLLHTTASGGSVPFWSHDGKWIYFAADVDAVSQIFKIPATGGEAVQLTRQGGLIARELPDGSRLYYSRISGKTEIWSVATDGTKEARVEGLPGFAWPAWNLTANGIYYYDSIPPDREIWFFDFATRRSRVVARTPGRPAPFVGNVTVSPDGKNIVYAQVERSAADIMLVDGFR